MATPLKVLYVDDEPDLLDLAKFFLEEDGGVCYQYGYIRVGRHWSS